MWVRIPPGSYRVLFRTPDCRSGALNCAVVGEWFDSSSTHRRGGVTGSRASLRNWWSLPCGFNSRPRHPETWQSPAYCARLLTSWARKTVPWVRIPPSPSGPVAQLAEAPDLRSVKRGFESHQGHYWRLFKRVCNSTGRVPGSYPGSCGFDSHRTHSLGGVPQLDREPAF